MPLAPFLLTSTDTVAFTWVDGIKIVLIPVLLFVLNRVFGRRDKISDEDRAKRNAEAKEREKRVDDDLKGLKEAKNSHEQRMTGFQMQHERFAEDINRRQAAMEGQLGQVSQLREDMAGMKVELKGYGKSIDEIKEMLRELLRK